MFLVNNKIYAAALIDYLRSSIHIHFLYIYRNSRYQLSYPIPYSIKKMFTYEVSTFFKFTFIAKKSEN